VLAQTPIDHDGGAHRAEQKSHQTSQPCQRQIQVTQANWVPGHVDEDQLVVDVSPGNDWTEVRVWFPPINALGTRAYAAHGFIHPRRQATTAELARATPVAARYALDTRGRPAPRARIDG
jgi:hypothetical protein